MNNALMVGYLESWKPNVTFTQAAQKGYDAIVMAFGAIDSLSVGVVGGCFSPAPGAAAMKQDIRSAKAAGARHILFSVGGGNNTFLPRGVPVDGLARAIVAHLTEYGFTGIDFDLEIAGDGVYLDRLCAAIRALDATLLITAAPQINQYDHSSDLYLVSTEHVRLYDQAVANGRFDYLFVQAYNNPWPRIGGYRQRQVGFLAAAFHNLKKTVPAGTLIAMGEPASAKAAGTSPFTASSASGATYASLADQYRSIRQDAQFGGAMVWSVGWDAEAGYPFVDAVKSAIHGTC